jgi:hypothetical protein
MNANSKSAILHLARKSAWQFLNKANDPGLSMLRKFASAVGAR